MSTGFWSAAPFLLPLRLAPVLVSLTVLLVVLVNCGGKKAKKSAGNSQINKPDAAQDNNKKEAAKPPAPTPAAVPNARKSQGVPNPSMMEEGGDGQYEDVTVG